MYNSVGQNTENIHVVFYATKPCVLKTCTDDLDWFIKIYKLFGSLKTLYSQIHYCTLHLPRSVRKFMNILQLTEITKHLKYI